MTKPKTWKDEIVEKVARAFYTEARRLDVRRSRIKPWSEQKDETKRNRWRAYARAALAVVPLAPRQAKEEEEVSEWQPIETAPKDGRTVLVYRYYEPFRWHVTGYARWSDVAGISGWLSYGFSNPPGNLGLAAPTHWSPIPSPPSGEPE